MQKNRYLVGTAVAVSAIVAGGMLGAPPALADPTTDDPLIAIARATPGTTDNAAAVTTKETGEFAIAATVEGADVKLPVDPSARISIGTNAGGLAVSLPFAAEADDAVAEATGVVSYDNNNGSTSVPVVTKDGSLQINTIIASVAAPKRYSYDLTIPDGGQVVQADDGYFILNAESNPVAYVAAPWAKDANGAEVPTHYELQGSTLIQVVDFASSTSFPVVADPQFAWHGILPSVQLTRNETKTATTATGMATVCGWVGRFTSAAGAALCGLNAASIIVNSQRIYFSEKRCAQLLIGPGAIATIGYSGGYCK